MPNIILNSPASLTTLRTRDTIPAITRASPSGKASAFQADTAGSNPVARSDRLDREAGFCFPELFEGKVPKTEAENSIFSFCFRIHPFRLLW